MKPNMHRYKTHNNEATPYTLGMCKPIQYMIYKYNMCNMYTTTPMHLLTPPTQFKFKVVLHECCHKDENLINMQEMGSGDTRECGAAIKEHAGIMVTSKTSKAELKMLKELEKP